jgi:uncharacterized metal-binding protein YceD (DUF177 family)
MTSSTARLPMSRPLCVADVTNGLATLHVVANKQEREVLARDLGILSVDSLEADVQLCILDDGDAAAQLSGTISARVVQACGVTLEPVDESIHAVFECKFGQESTDEIREEIEIPLSSLEPVEPIIDGIIDVGVVLVEQLSIEMNPFPRLEDSKFLGYSTDSQIDAVRNPFAALAALKPGSDERKG